MQLVAWFVVGFSLGLHTSSEEGISPFEDIGEMVSMPTLSEVILYEICVVSVLEAFLLAFVSAGDARGDFFCSNETK